MAILIFVLNVLFLVIVNGSSIPKFSDSYITKGRILLPYAEIDEPFTAYYDKTQNKSRIDYYDDLELTIQRADLQKYYKIGYMVNKHGQTSRVCFSMDGFRIEIQSIIPDLSKFKFQRRDVCKNFSEKIKSSLYCEEWQYSVLYGEKLNKYTFLLQRDFHQNATPVYYLMMGYNNILASHYDKYEIIYESYWTGTIDSKIFDIQKKYKCRSFFEFGKQALALMNPIREFIVNDYDHIDEHFDQFIKKHGKNYSLENEFHLRKSVFLQNYRFIMSHNRKNLHYRLAINHLADLSDKEIGKIRGRLQSKTRYSQGIYFNKTMYDMSNIPSHWDWRLVGAVTPVKDQAICGSCWAFGTIGTLEGAYFVKTGRLLKLSQQQLMDCSWPEGNKACEGGISFGSYKYIEKVGGISTEEEYGHYLGVDGKCHDSSVNKVVKIKGYYNVSEDEEALKAAIYYHAPVNVAINASPRTFSFYSYGIYYDYECDPRYLDHEVLAVGFGEINGQKYWLIKNSWSVYWGNNGYILINQKNNNCGVLNEGSFPIID